VTPTPAPPTTSSWPLTDGTYAGQENIGIVVTSGATQASLIAGGSGEVKWAIEVTPDLHYKVVFDSKLEFAETKPCDKPGVEFVGTLTKAP
jgi:hypothetical protein